MKILLINNNPVVSRLTALSARKEDIEIDEVQEVTELTAYKYDIVFVDADSWNADVKDTIFTNIETKKRVLFYSQDDNDGLDKFDKGILKPFLPSEVSAVIRSVEEMNTLAAINNEIEEEKSVDLVKESKEKRVEEVATELFTPDNINLASAEVKTDVKEKVEEKALLSDSDLKDDLFKENSEALNINAIDFAATSNKTDLFDLDLDKDKDKDSDNDLLNDELFTPEVKTTEKELDDELFEFDLEKDNELNLDEELSSVKDELEAKVETEKVETEKVETEKVETEIETKVLDAEEIGTIKNILEDDTSETLELEDLIAPSMAVGVTAMALSSDELVASEDTIVSEDSEKKTKKSEKEKDIIEDTESANNLMDALSTLKVESLRELLAGATISIKIEFPKA